MEILLIFTYIVILCVSAAFWFVKIRFNYWKKRGVPHVEPNFPFGHLKGMGSKYHLKNILGDMYTKFKAESPFFGTYFFLNPQVIITDLDLIRNVLIKDFQYFKDRNVYYNEKVHPLSATLFSLEGQQWRLLRQKLTPTFTTSKMKTMFPAVVEVSQRFVKTLRPMIAENPEIDIKSLLERFTIDVIGTCAFGVECNSLEDPKSEFALKGTGGHDNTDNAEMIRYFTYAFPWICRLFRVKSGPQDAEFFMRIVRETVDYREKNNVFRNDFMDLLIQLKNDQRDAGGDLGKFQMEQIAAQAYSFFSAGYETSSTTIGFALYELALREDIQEKARAEILHVLEEHDGALTYEALSKMTYLYQVLDETLRKDTPDIVLYRTTTEDYQVPDTKFTISKGTDVLIPVNAIHMDSDLYPNPEQFDPDRFLPEAVKHRHPMSFIPFGEGPRNCIALRFGKMQTMIGLIQLLVNFKFSRSPRTSVPVQFDPNNIVLMPVGGHILNIEYCGPS